MKTVFKTLFGIVKKLLWWLFISVLAFSVWNYFKEKREAKTFVVSFGDINGLRKGAPIYQNGLQVGKVVNIFPLGNTTKIGVKGLITSKDYLVPKENVYAKIANNLQTGGGKVLVIEEGTLNVDKVEQTLGKVKRHIQGQDTKFFLEKSYRLFLNLFEISKEFADSTFKSITSDQSLEFKDKVTNDVQNLISSLEYGTIKQDVKNKIVELNYQILETERETTPEERVRKVVDYQIRALKNTIGAFDSLSDMYKEKPSTFNKLPVMQKSEEL